MADRIDDAARALDRGLSIAGGSKAEAPLLTALGDAYLRGKRYRLAVDAYDRAVVVDAGWMPAHIGRVAALLADGKGDLGAAALTRLARVHPDAMRLHQRVSDTPTPSSSFVLYRQTLEGAPEKDPAVKETATGIAELFTRDEAAALKRFQRALTLDATAVPAGLFLSFLELPTTPAPAKARLWKLAAAEPKQPVPWLLLATPSAEGAQPLLTAGEADKAVEGLRALDDEDQRGAEVQTAIGALLLQTKKGDGVVNLRAAFAADPSYLPAKQALARIP
jgi:tetratricopeptide (TPR) repeat protein